MEENKKFVVKITGYYTVSRLSKKARCQRKIQSTLSSPLVALLARHQILFKKLAKSAAYSNNNREFKQITTAGATTAGATTAAVTEKVWGEYVSVVCQILSLASKAKYKDERNIS